MSSAGDARGQSDDGPEPRLLTAGVRAKHAGRWHRASVTLATVVTLAALLLSWEVGQRVLGPIALADQRNWIAVGQNFRVPEVASGPTATLYFLMSSNCHYCRQEAGFYRALNAAAVGRGARTVALLPGTPGAARAYLATLGLRTTQIVTADLKRLRIPALPMLLLTGPDDLVRAEWIGALDFAQQEGVFLHLGLVSPEFGSGGAPDGSVSPHAVERLLRGGAEVVDVREHAKFLRGHIKGAINIPGAELNVRAPHELAGGRLVLIYCSYCASCSSVRATEGIATTCDLSRTMLREAGYRGARVIGGDLKNLKKNGVIIVGSTQETQ